MSEVLELSLAPREIPVMLVDRSGQKKKYVLRELNGKERDAYLNEMSGKMTVGADGESANVTDYRGLQSALVARCLFDEKNEPVSEEFVQETLPCTTIGVLFAKAQEISGLTAEAPEEAKKD